MQQTLSLLCCTSIALCIQACDDKSPLSTPEHTSFPSKTHTARNYHAPDGAYVLHYKMPWHKVDLKDTHAIHPDASAAFIQGDTLALFLSEPLRNEHLEDVTSSTLTILARNLKSWTHTPPKDLKPLSPQGIRMQRVVAHAVLKHTSHAYDYILTFALHQGTLHRVVVVAPTPSSNIQHTTLEAKTDALLKGWSFDSKP